MATPIGNVAEYGSLHLTQVADGQFAIPRAAV